MSKAKWKLDPELVYAIIVTEDDLRSVYEKLQSEFDKVPDLWRESDQGKAVDFWLESLKDTADQMDVLRTSAF